VCVCVCVCVCAIDAMITVVYDVIAWVEYNDYRSTMWVLMI